MIYSLHSTEKIKKIFDSFSRSCGAWTQLENQECNHLRNQLDILADMNRFGIALKLVELIQIGYRQGVGLGVGQGVGKGVGQGVDKGVGQGVGIAGVGIADGDFEKSDAFVLPETDSQMLIDDLTHPVKQLLLIRRQPLREN